MSTTFQFGIQVAVVLAVMVWACRVALTRVVPVRAWSAVGLRFLGRCTGSRRMQDWALRWQPPAQGGAGGTGCGSCGAGSNR